MNFSLDFNCFRQWLYIIIFNSIFKIFDILIKTFEIWTNRFGILTNTLRILTKNFDFYQNCCNPKPLRFGNICVLREAHWIPLPISFFPVRSHALYFNSFYRIIKCVFAILSKNLMRFLLWNKNKGPVILTYSIAKSNAFCNSIAKTNAFPQKQRTCILQKTIDVLYPYIYVPVVLIIFFYPYLY